MSKGRYLTHRADSNHWKVLKDFRNAGFLAEDVHNGTLCDIIVCGYRRPFLFEVKAHGKRDQLTKKQSERAPGWQQVIHVIESAEEGFAIMEKEAFK